MNNRQRGPWASLLLALVTGAVFLHGASFAADALAPLRTQWKSIDPKRVTASDHQMLVAQLETAGRGDSQTLIHELQNHDAPPSFPVDDIVAALGRIHNPGLAGDLVRAALADPPSSKPLLKAAGLLRDPSALPILIKSLDTKDFELGDGVVAALQAYGSDRGSASTVAQELQNVYRTGNELLKYRVIDVVRGCNAPQMKNLLPPILTGTDSDPIKAAAIRAMAGYRASASFQQQVLRIASNSSSNDILKDATLALGRWRNVDALPLLIRLLSNPNEGVKSNAASALRGITGLNSTISPADWTRWLEATRVSEQGMLKVILAKLGSSAEGARPVVIESMEALVLYRGKALEALQRYLHDPDYRTRAACLNIMGQFGDVTQCFQIQELLRDPKPEVSYAAWRALKDISGRDFPRDYEAWAGWVRDIQ